MSQGSKRVCLAIPSLQLAGAEMMVRNLALALDSRGVDIRVWSLYNLSTSISDELQDRGIPVRFFDKRPGYDPRLALELARSLTTEEIGVIHSNLPILKYVVPAARRTVRSTRVVHTFHNLAHRETASRLVRFQNHWYLRSAEVIPVALSPEVQASIGRQYGLDEGRVPVIPNGVPLDRFSVPDRLETGSQASAYRALRRR